MYYVYVYFNPLKSSDMHTCGFEPFYVGKGKKDRMRHHLFESNLKGDTNKHKANTIRKILSVNLIPHIEIIQDNLSEAEAFNLERSLILQFGRADKHLGPLTNLTDGGEGASGKIFSPEYRKKLSNAAKLVKRSDASKAKLSKALSGRKQSDEHIAKRAAARTGSKLSDESKHKISEAQQKIRQTDEWKAKASESQRGKKHSKDHIDKSIISNPNTRSVEIFGIQYISRNQALKATGLTPNKLEKEPSFKYL